MTGSISERETKPSVAVLDYGMGNLHSVAKALEAAGAEATVVTSLEGRNGSDALCVPGQGILDRCLAGLRATGAGSAVASWIEAGRPYLGICLGMQLLFERSEEAGGTTGLGLLRGEVRRLPDRVTVPHIGWNTVGDEYYYFDHSYAVHPTDGSIVRGWCDHGDRFAAHIETGSVVAVQFHPEKSGSAGIDLLRGWVAGL